MEIKLAKPEPLYGIILQGSRSDDKFVTSYHIMYSEDGLVFSFINGNKKEPIVFQGPIDKQIVQQIFNPPIEASVVRIIPLTWHNGIAIRAQLLGCKDDLTTEDNWETTSHESWSTTESWVSSTIVVEPDFPPGKF